jgi:hypothetical protein
MTPELMARQTRGGIRRRTQRGDVTAAAARWVVKRTGMLGGFADKVRV